MHNNTKIVPNDFLYFRSYLISKIIGSRCLGGDAFIGYALDCRSGCQKCALPKNMYFDKFSMISVFAFGFFFTYVVCQKHEITCPLERSGLPLLYNSPSSVFPRELLN